MTLIHGVNWLVVGWLVVWLVGSVGWLVGWLVGWFAGLLVGWFAGWLVCWLVGLLVGWFLGWMVWFGWLVRRFVGWLVGWLVSVNQLVSWTVKPVIRTQANTSRQNKLSQRKNIPIFFILPVSKCYGRHVLQFVCFWYVTSTALTGKLKCVLRNSISMCDLHVSTENSSSTDWKHICSHCT